MFDESGLLREVLPEVSAMKGVAQPPEFHPEGDVLSYASVARKSAEPLSAHVGVGSFTA